MLLRRIIEYCRPTGCLPDSKPSVPWLCVLFQKLLHRLRHVPRKLGKKAVAAGWLFTRSSFSKRWDRGGEERIVAAEWKQGPVACNSRRHAAPQKVVRSSLGESPEEDPDQAGEPFFVVGQGDVEGKAGKVVYGDPVRRVDRSTTRSVPW